MSYPSQCLKFRKSRSIISLPNGDASKSERDRTSFKTVGGNQDSVGQLRWSPYGNSVVVKQHFKAKRYQARKGEESLSQAECWSNRLSGKEEETRFREEFLRHHLVSHYSQ